MHTDHQEDQDADGLITLKWILEIYDGMDRSASGQGQLESFCEHGNKPSGTIKCWEILE
jgi:hypothetical protein